MPVKPQLELHSFELTKEAIPIPHLYGLTMPDSWSDFLKKNRHQYRYDFKLTLGKKLQSMFPEILAVRFDEPVIFNGKPWIVAAKPLDTDRLARLCMSWFQQRMQKKSLADLPATIRYPDMRWEPFDDPLQEPYVFHVVPSIFALDFAQKPFNLYSPQRDLRVPIRWHVVHFDNKHQIMSQPIPSRKNDDQYFSYFTDFKTVTKAGETGKYFLNIRTGIRRLWTTPLIENGKYYISHNKKLPVLVSVDNPYEYQELRSFTQLKICAKKDSDSKGMTMWESKTDELFFDIVLDRQVLNSDALLQNPAEYLHGRDGVWAILYYSPQIFSFYGSEVKAGAGLPERRRVFDIFRDTYPKLKPVPRAEFVGGQRRKKRNTQGNKAFLSDAHAEIQLELWTEREEIEDLVMEKLYELFKIQQIQERQYCILDPETNCVLFTLEVYMNDPKGITDELDGSLSPEAAKNARVRHIEKSLVKGSSANPILALVEVKDFRNMKKEIEKKDPKAAIRKGMVNTNRLTQFIVGGEKDLKHRVMKGLEDLLADRGFLHEKWLQFDIIGEHVGLEVIYLGQKLLPVLSWVKNRRVYVKIYGEESWLPLHQALISVNTCRKISGKNKDAIVNFLEENLIAILGQTNDIIYVYTNAPLRKYWSQITNSNLARDRLPFQSPHLLKHTNLRFIRVNNTDDVPYYDLLGKGEYSKGSGLFVNEDVYYSVGKKPDSFEKIGNNTQKIDRPNSMIQKQQAVELFICGCKDRNERDQVALMTHMLRDVHLTYNVHTKFPFPLHRLQAVKKYIEVITGENDQSEVEEQIVEV